MQKRKPVALADKTNLSSSTGKSLIKSPPNKVTSSACIVPSSDFVAFDNDGNIVSSEDSLRDTIKEVLEENRMLSQENERLRSLLETFKEDNNALKIYAMLYEVAKAELDEIYGRINE